MIREVTMKKKEMQKKIKKEKQDMRAYNLSDSDKNIRNGIIIALSVIIFIALMFVFTKIKTGEWKLFTKENNIFYTAEAQTEKIILNNTITINNRLYC